MFRVVIPARYDSTRLPGKALRVIAGKPMLQWVYECALGAQAREVLIATDDERIATAARGFGAESVMTAASHSSGSDRIAEVARARAWKNDDIVVNVQGDEPLLPSALIGQVAQLLATHAQADIATLATPCTTREELLDPNVVKVVTDAQGMALYFSRAPIPWERDRAPTGAPCAAVRRHRGLYAYRVSALLRLTSLPAGVLEGLEQLEQLRALEHGLRICVADAIATPGPDVNTAADLARVETLLSRRSS